MYNAQLDYEQFQTFQRQQWENFQTFQKQQWDQFNQFSRDHRESTFHPRPQTSVRSYPQAYLPHAQQAPQYLHPQPSSFNFSDDDQHFSPILNRFREPQQFEEQHPLRWLYNLFENHTNPQEGRVPRRVVIPRGYQEERSDPTVETAEEIEESAKQDANENEQAANRWVDFLKYLHNKQQEATNRRKQASDIPARKEEAPTQQQKKIEESHQTGSSPLDFLGDIFQGFKKQGQSQEQANPQPQPVKKEAGKAQAAKRDSQIPVRPAEKPLTTQERLDKVASDFEAIKANLSNGKPRATESKLMTLLTLIDDIHCEDEKQKAFRHKLAAEINRTIESLLESTSKSASAPKVAKSEEEAPEVKLEGSEDAVPPSETINIPIFSSDADGPRSIPVSEPESHSNIPVTACEASGPALGKEEPSPSQTLDKMEEEYAGISILIESKSLTDRKSIKATENKLNKLLFALDEFQCPADLRPRKKELVKNINNAIELLLNLEAPSPAPSPAVQPAHPSVEESAPQPESAPESVLSDPIQVSAEHVAESAPEEQQVSESTPALEEPSVDADAEAVVHPDTSAEPASSSAEENNRDAPKQEAIQESLEQQEAPESSQPIESSANEQAVEISSTTAPVEEASTTDTVACQSVLDTIPAPVVDDVLIESVPVGTD